MSTTSTTTAYGFHEIIHHDENINSNEPALYAIEDATLLKEWSDHHNLDRRHLPRVLIYTWCTEDTFERSANEVYWKQCYAHSHGFDIVFSGAQSFTGVSKWLTIQQYLFSGQYDYVFMMGADSLILESNLNFPVWAWDRGHDMTLMDQYHFFPPDASGLHDSNILFRPTEFVRKFIEEGFVFRNGFHAPSDYGEYMENILIFLGREFADQKSYENKCTEFLIFRKQPELLVMYTDNELVRQFNGLMSHCFFQELDRLAGPHGSRKSKNIGFHPPFDQSEEDALMPNEVNDITKLAPWANCWSTPRKWWPKPLENCFAFHYDEPKDLKMFGKIVGTCPDPTFDWTASPYNYVNRQKEESEREGEARAKEGE